MSDVANPLIAARQDSTTGWSGIGIAEGIDDLIAGIDSGSWIDSTIGGFATSMEALVLVVDPLGTLVSWGVAWLMEHVKPLSDALDWLAGDPDQINAYAATWQNVSASVAGTAQDLVAAVRRELIDWSGAAADAYRAHAAEQIAALDGITKSAHAIGQIVQGAGLVVALVREMVRDLIADFVSVLAVRLWEWMAEAGLTLGLATPLVIAQVGGLVAKWVAKIAGLIAGLLRTMKRLMPVIRNLDEMIDALKQILRKLARRGPDGESPPAPDGTRSPDTTVPTRPADAYHSNGDPMRELGSGRDTHPEEWNRLQEEAREYGVEVIQRDGGIFYTPGTSPGNPGQLVIDPDASISAMRHEMSHVRDDQQAGWLGFRGVYDRDYLWRSEFHAYMVEVSAARELGRYDLARELLKLARARRSEVYDAE